jgi:hypothetical protein
MEYVHENLKTMRIDVSEVKMGNYSFPTHLGTNATSNFSTPEDPHWMRVNLMLGSEPFIQFETPYPEDLDEYEAYMSHYYPEIKLSRTRNNFNRSVIFGLTRKASCNHVTFANPLQNFTFNTSHEHQFHIPAQGLLFDSHFGQ